MFVDLEIQQAHSLARFCHDKYQNLRAIAFNWENFKG